MKTRRASVSRRSPRHAARVLFLAVSVLLTATLAPVTARALELVMYDKAGCVWCNRFERDIGRRYSSIDVSRDAPLRRVDIHDQRRSGIDLEEPVLYTPTFVLADDNGAEIGRITGYQGEEAFWANLDDLLRARPGRRAY